MHVRVLLRLNELIIPVRDILLHSLRLVLGPLLQALLGSPLSLASLPLIFQCLGLNPFTYHLLSCLLSLLLAELSLQVNQAFAFPFN
jgi:uncharacterized protein YacL